MELDTLLALGHLDPVERELLVDYTLVGVTSRALAARDGMTVLEVETKIDGAAAKLRDLIDVRAYRPVKLEAASMPLCACGCGQPVGAAVKTDARRGTVKGRPTRFLPHHQPRKEMA